MALNPLRYPKPHTSRSLVALLACQVVPKAQMWIMAHLRRPRSLPSRTWEAGAGRVLGPEIWAFLALGLVWGLEFAF